MKKKKNDIEIKILIVDDSRANLKYLENLVLLKYDITIMTAISGSEALEYLKKNDFALILLDVMMPEMNGYEVIKRIKQDNTIKDIPIILISALGDDIRNVEKGISLGAVDFISKPINQDVLLGKIKVFINLYQQRKELSNLINQLESVNLRLSESEKRFKKLSLAAVDAIIVVDNSNQITFWNNSAEKIFGYKKEEIINEDISAVIRFPDFFNIKETGLPELFNKRILSVSSKVYEMEGIRNNQTIIALELSFSVFSINLDKHAVIIARDITRRKRLERELLKAKELRESNKTMKQFIDNINHELLTPVNIIKGLSNSLLAYNKNELSVKQSEAIKHINENSHKLNFLIENLLAFKKPAQYKSSEIDLKKLFERIEKYAKGKLNNKDVEFFINIDETIPKIFNSDRQKIEHIMINLIENAIKFTERGQINLNVKMKDNGIQFLLSDTGIGIENKELNSILRKFRQSDGSSERKYGGLGLGLTVISKLVKQMKGKMQIESEKNIGTKILIEIPEIIQEEN